MIPGKWGERVSDQRSASRSSRPGSARSQAWSGSFLRTNSGGRSSEKLDAGMSLSVDGEGFSERLKPLARDAKSASADPDPARGGGLRKFSGDLSRPVGR